MYFVVQFIEKDGSHTVSHVPASWVEDGKCYFPEKNTAKFITMGCTPKSSWPVFDITILGHAGVYHNVLLSWYLFFINTFEIIFQLRH